MVDKAQNITKIIKKLLSDPRVVGAVTQVLTEILSENPNLVSNQPVSTKPQQAPRQIDWESKTDDALRQTYAYRKKHNIEIEPELNDILARRFPGYDATQQKFTGRGRGGKRKSAVTTVKTEKPAVDQKVIDWSTKSNAVLRSSYAYRKKKGIAIEPELNAELAKRFPGYDAEKQIFTGRVRTQKQEKVRIINWAEKTDDILRKAYKHRQKTGIDDALNAELARRFPAEYDAQSRTFIPQKKTHKFTTKAVQKSAVATALQHRVTGTSTATRPAPVTTAQPTTNVQPAPKPAQSTPTQLSVKLKLVKQTLTDSFYDVYVNGKKILHNHINTDVKVFADGTLLGIYGAIQNERNMPQRPFWLLYKTDITRLQWSGRDSITKIDTYAKSVSVTETAVNVQLSNKCLVIYENEKLKRLAGRARFEIER